MAVYAQSKNCGAMPQFLQEKRRGKNEKENEELFTYIVTPIYELKKCINIKFL